MRVWWRFVNSPSCPSTYTLPNGITGTTVIVDEDGNITLRVQVVYE